MKKNKSKQKKFVRPGLCIDALLKLTKKTKEDNNAVTAVLGAALLMGLTAAVATSVGVAMKTMADDGVTEIKELGREFISEIRGVIHDMKDIRDDAYSGYERTDENYAFIKNNNPYIQYDEINGTIIFRMPSVEMEEGDGDDSEFGNGVEFAIPVEELEGEMTIIELTPPPE